LLAGLVLTSVGLTGCGYFSPNKITGSSLILPATLSFGSVQVGQTASLAVAVQNAGNVPVTISQISLSGQSFAVTGAGSLPVTLAAGSSLNLAVQFAPASTTATSGALTISSNATTNPTATVTLSGTGAGSGSNTPTLSVNPTSLNFGSVTVNAPATQSISLVSSGSAALTINSLAVSGAGFTLVPVSLPATLNSGQTLTVGVQFDPTATGNFTGQLVISSNSSTNSTVNVALTGAGTASTTVPNLTVTPTTVDFGTVTVSKSSSQIITLSSTGSAPVTINSLTMSGSNFSVTGLTAPTSLNPGQSASLTLVFAPTATGAASGQLTITSNSSANPTATVLLSGNGTQHIVDLNWKAPAASSDPPAGYHVYRSISGANAYQFLGTVDVSLTAYTDLTAQSATTYDYVVKSVDTQGVESTPSNVTTAVIP
jgi:hypothetical protein